MWIWCAYTQVWGWTSRRGLVSAPQVSHERTWNPKYYVVDCTSVGSLIWEAGMQASQTLRHVSATSRSGSLQSLRESVMDEDRVSDIETVHAVCGPGLRMLTTGRRKWNRLSGLCPAAVGDHSSPLSGAHIPDVSAKKSRSTFSYPVSWSSRAIRTASFLVFCSRHLPDTPGAHLVRAFFPA